MAASTLRSSALLRQTLGLNSATSALRSQTTARWAMQRAAFQTSARMAILPPLPQRIEGTVNDPVKVPHAHPSHGSYHWTAERLVSVGLVPLTILPFAVGSLNPLLDGTLISLIMVHSYIGFQACITDYFPGWRVPLTRKLSEWANVLALVVVGWGWYEFETNDVGLTEAVKRIWRAQPKGQ